MDEKQRRKRKLELVLYDGDGDGDDGSGTGISYKFKVLLPNGMTVMLRLPNPKPEMWLTDFIKLVKQEYNLVLRNSESSKKKRSLNWDSQSLVLEDANGNLTKQRIRFTNFKPCTCNILRLHDGSLDVTDTYENMWDLTPDTDLLRELPEEYTFETALADLIDNSLQAVWSVGENGRKLISVEVQKERISIFDTGPGMDASEENSIVKWGKMGASLHRSFKAQAIGVKPPYLIPFFGMFGYGGPIASMHLGRRALVSSKTKESKKVYALYLEREALLRNSGSEKSELTWKTNGSMRDPSEDEIVKSPQRSFTKVEILEPKIRELDVFRLQCKLKDIYFPYIQCDELSKTGKTATPVEFQINGINLAEIEGGEFSTTNLHSCNGPEFVFQLRFSIKQDVASSRCSGSRAFREANARLKCAYFPISEGKESIEKILENLQAKGCGVRESFETFSRVSIRRLGRLLPDARWTGLPFMDFKQKKGDKAHLLKICCLRVKCFVETDAGFYPTLSKTDLAHHNPFTIALKNFGSKILEGEKDVDVEILRHGKLLNTSHLQKEYEDWILDMHSRYDKEIDAGEDDGVVVIGPTNKKALGIVSDVVRVHCILKRKGATWKRDQKIKVLKGAGPGLYKNNLYATLEYFLIEGFQGDAGGDARIICRPLDVEEENGCMLSMKDGNARLDLRGSSSLPISVIDSGKCQAMGSSEWDCQLQKQCQKTPSTIELLCADHCQELKIDGAFPVVDTVHAGQIPPRKIVAVVRPGNYNSSSNSKSLDQKFIVKTNLEMSMEVKFRRQAEDQFNHVYSARMTPSSHEGFSGLYIFSLGCKFPTLFKEAGLYKFLFNLDDKRCNSYEKRLKVKASSKVGMWKLLNDKRSQPFIVRVGSVFPSFCVACFDSYSNRIPFSSVPGMTVKVTTDLGVLVEIDGVKAHLSSDKMTLEVEDVLVECKELDRIRPSYKATLVLCPLDGLVSVSIPCQVMPGSLEHIEAKPPIQEAHLLPDFVVNELVLEMLDAYGNHVREGLEIQLNVDGFHILDKEGTKRKVDSNGCIDLSGLLKVTAGFDKIVSLSISSNDKVLFNQDFQTEKRELRIASKVPKICTAGSDLENIVFEVVNSQGEVDHAIHNEEKYGQFHSLTIKSDTFNSEDSTQYTFRHGRCTIPAIRIPHIQSSFCFIASHSRYSELQLSVKVSVKQALKGECDEIQSPHSSRKALVPCDPSSLEHVQNLVQFITNPQKGLEGDIDKYGKRVGDCEKVLKDLNDEKARIEQEMYGLQSSSMELLSFNNGNLLPTKDKIMEQIQSRNNSAASILCQLSRELSFQEPRKHFLEDIVGLVALLGTVSSNKLSRILAKYLGEDKMLAVVCRSLETANALEAYQENGEVDHMFGLHAEAAALGKSIHGCFDVICLEDIRPYKGELEGTDSQRRLVLPDPILPCGNKPSGFIGYAVNMVDVDTQHLDTRTAAGHSLRETLLYCLFGKLQVYETRKHMKEARAFIKHGAVSLDGGILRKNSILSLGCWNPEICFPVVISENKVHLSPHGVQIKEKLEARQADLQLTEGRIARLTGILEKAKTKLNRRTKKYSKLMDQIELVLKDCHPSNGNN